MDDNNILINVNDDRENSANHQRIQPNFQRSGGKNKLLKCACIFAILFFTVAISFVILLVSLLEL